LPNRDHLVLTQTSGSSKAANKSLSSCQDDSVSSDGQHCLDEIKVDSAEKARGHLKRFMDGKQKFQNSEEKAKQNHQVWFSETVTKVSGCPKTSNSPKENKSIVTKTDMFTQSISSLTSIEANVSIENVSNKNSEIIAAARSLKTNIILTLVFILVFVCLAFLSDPINIIIGATLKGMIPILATIANFGKIQALLLIYSENTKSQFNKLLNFIPKR
jgi:hypothetical protein